MSSFSNLPPAFKARFDLDMTCLEISNSTAITLHSLTPDGDNVIWTVVFFKTPNTAYCFRLDADLAKAIKKVIEEGKSLGKFFNEQVKNVCTMIFMHQSDEH